MTILPWLWRLLRELHGVRPVSSVCFAVTFYRQAIGIHFYQYSPIFIRTQQRTAVVGVALHDILIGMAEAVAIAYGKHRIAGMHRGYEWLCG